MDDGPLASLNLQKAVEDGEVAGLAEVEALQEPGAKSFSQRSCMFFGALEVASPVRYSE